MAASWQLPQAPWVSPPRRCPKVTPPLPLPLLMLLLLLSMLACCPLEVKGQAHSHNHQGHHVSADPGTQQQAEPHQHQQQPESHASHQEHSGMSMSMPMSASSQAPLIVVIFDGLRHDYLEVYKARGLNLSNFDTLLREGVRATQVRSAYPTETMPNHQSLVTGLYPESHGILFNSFLDSGLQGRKFSMYDQASLNDPSWYSGWPEPLWLTNQRQGGRSAVVLYPNADAAYNGSGPFLQVDQYMTLNGAPSIYPHSRRVDRLLQWLSSPQLYGPVNLALLYFDEPDATGHVHGPVSDAVGAALLAMDLQLGRLMQGLRKLGLLDSVNLIVTADHGMTATDASKVINLSSLLPADSYTNLLGTQVGVHAHLAPRGSLTAAQLAARVRASGQAGLTAFDTTASGGAGGGLPAELHLARCQRRLPPVLLRADPPWLIRLNASAPLSLGTHGYYGNASADMRPLWLARGPAFKRGGASHPDPVESVDLYPLACHLLGLRPNPNNGSLARIAGVLARAPGEEGGGGSSGGFLANFAGLLALFALFGALLLVTGCVLAAASARKLGPHGHGRAVRGELE